MGRMINKLLIFENYVKKDKKEWSYSHSKKRKRINQVKKKPKTKKMIKKIKEYRNNNWILC